jgi:hypothetical protein
MPMPRIAAAGTSLSLTACLLLSACTASPYRLNDELAVGAGAGGTYRPATFSSEFSLAGREAAAREPGVPAAASKRRSLVLATTEEPEQPAGALRTPEPSHTRLDRANWEPIQITVPNELPAHQPRYTQNLIENTHLARNRGDYPTALSANEYNHPKAADAQVFEAVAAPVGAAADLVLLLPRAMVTRPWQTTRTGMEPYRRVPNPTASLSTVETTPRVRTRRGIDDPTAAPVQVPVGERFPVTPREAP